MLNDHERVFGWLHTSTSDDEWQSHIESIHERNRTSSSTTVHIKLRFSPISNTKEPTIVHSRICRNARDTPVAIQTHTTYRQTLNWNNISHHPNRKIVPSEVVEHSLSSLPCLIKHRIVFSPKTLASHLPWQDATTIRRFTPSPFKRQVEETISAANLTCKWGLPLKGFVQMWEMFGALRVIHHLSLCE